MNRELEDIKTELRLIINDTFADYVKDTPLSSSDYDCAYDCAMGRLVDQILSLETKTCRIAVVRKRGKFPDNPYPVISGAKYDTAYDDWDIPSVIDGASYRDYDLAQIDMTRQGFVQEVRSE